MSICADCDYFTLKLGRRDIGVCFAKWLPDLTPKGYATYGAYVHARPYEGTCDNFTPVGTLERLEPERG